MSLHQLPGRATAALPPDRAGVDTEQRNLSTQALHAQSVDQLVAVMAREDRAVLQALDAAGPAIAAFIRAVEPAFSRTDRPGRLIYVGAGTSGRLGVLDASEAPPTFCVPPGRIVGIIAGGDAALRKSSEGLEDAPDGARSELASLGLDDADAVLAIAAGGTTPYARGALAVAKSLAPGCVTGLLSCSATERPDGCDHLIVLPTGPEVLTGSTRMKAGTATKLALNTISTALMIRSGRVYQNLMVDVAATNDKLRDRAARVVSTLTGVSRERAFEAVERAGGSAKIAVVMLRLNVTRDDARDRLAKASGRLERVIGD